MCAHSHTDKYAHVRMHANTPKSVGHTASARLMPNDAMHTRSFIIPTHTRLFSNRRSRLLLTSPTTHALSVPPLHPSAVPVWLCWCLASLTGALKLTAWFVLQHKHAWEHQFPWHGWGKKGRREGVPGNDRDCVSHFKVELESSGRAAFQVAKLRSTLLGVKDCFLCIHASEGGKI